MLNEWRGSRPKAYCSDGGHHRRKQGLGPRPRRGQRREQHPDQRREQEAERDPLERAADESQNEGVGTSSVSRTGDLDGPDEQDLLVHDE